VSNLREEERLPIHVSEISLNPITPEDDDRRAICHERAVRASLNNRSKLVPIKRAGVPLKSSGSGRAHLPRDMRDMIFEATTGSLTRIAPVVFGDELFQTPPSWMFWRANGLSRDLAPPAVNLPLIRSRLAQSFRLDAVLH
ncbi:MAG: hypothetical protein WAN41_21000, partial [Candidatus Sulfotelmatobacter sp.]